MFRLFKVCYPLIFFASLSGCVQMSSLSPEWSENFGQATYGAEASHSALNDGDYETVAVARPSGRERFFMLEFQSVKPVHKIVIHNDNLFRFDVDYLNPNTGEWTNVHQVRQRRNIGNEPVQLKYVISPLNIKTRLIRINVLRTIHDGVVSKDKDQVSEDDQVVNRVRRVRVGKYEEKYRVKSLAPATLREIEVYQSVKGEHDVQNLQIETTSPDTSGEWKTSLVDTSKTNPAAPDMAAFDASPPQQIGMYQIPQREILPPPSDVPMAEIAFAPGKTTRVEIPEANDYGFFLLYVPKDYTPASSWPIIFSYPGHSLLATLFPFRQVTHGLGFIIVGMPLKPIPDDLRPDAQPPDDEADSNAQFSYFDQTLSIVSSHLNVDKNAVFMGGFSRGAFMTSFLGERMLARLRGLILWGGSREYNEDQMPSSTLMRSKPIFVGIGEHDYEYILGAKEAARIYRSLGADVTYEEWPDTGHGPSHIVLAHETELGEWLIEHSPGQPSRTFTPLVQIRDEARAAQEAGQLGHALTLYQEIIERDKNGKFGMEAVRAAQQIIQGAETQLAGVESMASKSYREIAEYLDGIAQKYAGSIFADQAKELKRTRLNSDADALEMRALAAEKVKNYTGALQLYQLYLTYFPDADRYPAVKAHVKVLKAKSAIQRR